MKKNLKTNFKKTLSSILTTTVVAMSVTSVFAYTDVYRVKRGDTVYRISKTYNVSVDEISRLNKLENPAKIYVGQKLYVPVPSKPNTNDKPETANTKPPQNGTGAATTDEPSTGTITKPPSSNTSGSGSTSSGDKTPLKPPTNNTDNAMAKKVLDLVNIERKKAGLSPLKLNTEVTSVAQVKSDDMAKNGYFDHNSPTYGSPFAMLTSFGVSYRTAGENIAKGQQTPEAVMKAWMNSTGHRENILSPKFKELGVGYTANNGSPVWVQIFVTQ